MATFGEKLKRLRVESKGLSLGEAAKQLDIPKSNLNNYERNSSKPPLDVLVKLSVFYNTTVDYLVGYEQDTELMELVSMFRELSPEHRASIRNLIEGLKK